MGHRGSEWEVNLYKVRAYNEEEREKYQANINACRAFEVEEPFQLRKNQEKRKGEYM